MKAKTKHEIEKAGILKAARTAIRLKYSLMSDEALAKVLPGLEKRIDDALLKGKSFKMSFAELLDSHA